MSKGVIQTLLLLALTCHSSVLAVDRTFAEGSLEKGSSVKLDLADSVTPDNVANAEGDLPLVASPRTRATARINASLEKLNSAWHSSKRACLGKGAPPDVSAEREARLTMDLGGYLSLVVNEQWSCAGAPHPDADTLAFVYDLRSGAPLSWMHVFPTRLTAASHVESTGGGIKIGLLASSQLDNLYVQAARADLKFPRDAAWWSECSGAITDSSLDFVAWPDAKRVGIVLEPVLAHAVQNCANDELISISRLRAEGANEDFLRAIESAHGSRRK